MHVLLVDNYDSFTFNLYQLASEIFGPDVVVMPNDTDWQRILDERFDAVIISPGPGRPERPADFGISRNVLTELNLPVLGVCLGHQGICNFSGGRVCHAPLPMHGRLSDVHHDGRGLFAGIPNPFRVVRYHSLIGAEPLPSSLQKTAWTEDGILMGVSHKEKPIWGVQFHPESISTQYGRELLMNFRKMAEAWHSSSPSNATRTLGANSRQATQSESQKPAESKKSSLFVKRAKLTLTPTEIFEKLFATKPYAFWLDSSLHEEGRARFSFMGGDSHQSVNGFRYYAAQHRLETQVGPRFHCATEDLFTSLRASMAATAVEDSNLPFDFSGGLVGYFGYELKTLCGAHSAHRSDHPDAYLLKVERFVAIDHETNDLYLIALYQDEAGRRAAEAWCDKTTAALDEKAAPIAVPLQGGRTTAFRPSQSHAEYLKSIDDCLTAIRDGESYEVCLTNQLQAETTIAPFDYYKRLRERNPAPYSAFLQFPELSVACSSPERFLTISRNGDVETKPIKGTARRGVNRCEDEDIKRDLENDEKSRSENLMICDLLRNDLGRVCEVGTVKVPKLMHVETYATVHQLVSTVTGHLRNENSAVDCLHAAFPGGSMTGAPKIRTMEIIDSLERVARGVYSGAIGFLSYTGAADLNIVIRTAVFSGNQVTIGVGGAIVALSDPEEEWNEIRLKAHALLSTFAEMSRTAVDLELMENQVIPESQQEEEQLWK